MKNSEHIEQVKLFTWAKLQSNKHVPLTMMFAIPNGGQRNIVTATKLKAEGVKSGVPDIMLAYPSKHAHGLFIEMKSVKGSLSENQREWISTLSSNGYQCNVCYSFDEAKKIICDYLEI
jgi:hypothetical protein